ncbi:MAG TPA: gluconolaconase [Bacteroides sp.]|nr:gluconolaconase [Bacteroides sp.]
MKKIAFLAFLAMVLAGCNPSGKKDTVSAEQSFTSYTLTEVWHTDTVLLTCESVLFDQTRELLFVSCMNGSAGEKDGDGYISLLGPDGSVKSLRWVTGLNDPKGMGIIGNLLYVADLDELVIIDIEMAEVSERIPVEGASFLNDVAVSEDGKVYFSDSDKGILWIYSNGELMQWVAEGLQRPNGLYVEPDRVLLTSSGSQDLRVIDRSTGEYEIVTTGIGAGDGVEFTGMEGYYITSSWAGEVFLIRPDYSKVSLLKTSDREINSADIGFNERDQVLYVPTFFDNRVVAYRLEVSNI